MTKEVPVLLRIEDIYIGNSYVPDIKTFQCSERHIYITVYYLSEKWGMIISQYTIKINKTTQKFLRSSVIPLDRRYHTDRLFTTKTLQG